MRILLRSLVLLALTLGLVALSFLQQPWNVHLSISCGSGALYTACNNAAKAFAKESGYTVHVKESPSDLTLHLNYLQALVDSTSTSVDVYLLESTWVGTLADGLLPLDDTPRDDFFTASLENNRVHGRLLALPFTLDIGVLYARDDLLSTYGYEVPKTWQALLEMSKTIADKENIQPYLFPSDADNYTAQAVEWFTSEGASTIVEPSKYITLQNVPALRTVSSAWFARFSALDLLTEDEALTRWQKGDAVFMRHWLQKSLEQDLRGFVTALPVGESGSHGALGGWQLGVNKETLHAKEALEFLAFMTRYDTQKTLAEQSFLPAHTALYHDRDLQELYPIFVTLPEMFERAVSRPSSVTGRRYRSVATTVHDVLTSNRAPEEKIRDLVDELSRIKQGTW
jgi:trehalose/maltose transport system substrate-binding protein